MSGIVPERFTSTSMPYIPESIGRTPPEAESWSPGTGPFADGLVEVKVKMHESTYARLVQRADREGCSLSALCSRLLTDT